MDLDIPYDIFFPSAIVDGTFSIVGLLGGCDCNLHTKKFGLNSQAIGSVRFQAENKMMTTRDGLPVDLYQNDLMNKRSNHVSKSGISVRSSGMTR